MKPLPMGPYVHLGYNPENKDRTDNYEQHAPSIFAFVNQRIVKLWDKKGDLSRFELEDLYDLNKDLYDVYGDDDEDLEENKKALKEMLKRPNCVDDRPDEMLHGRNITRRYDMRREISSTHNGMIFDLHTMKYSSNKNTKIDWKIHRLYKQLFDEWIRKGYFSKNDIYKRVFRSEKDFDLFESIYKEWSEGKDVSSKVDKRLKKKNAKTSSIIPRHSASEKALSNSSSQPKRTN